MEHIVHPVVVRSMINTLRKIEPRMSVAYAANLAGDIIDGLHSQGISVIPDLVLDQRIEILAEDPYQRMVRMAEAWEAANDEVH